MELPDEFPDDVFTRGRGRVQRHSEVTSGGEPMREARIEEHLKRRVEVQGRRGPQSVVARPQGCADRLVLLEDRLPTFVELKRPGLTADPHQEREHKKLRKYHCCVINLDTKEDRRLV